MKARVVVTLRPGIPDTPGEAVAEALAEAGFDGVSVVRQGRVFDFELEAEDEAAAHSVLVKIARQQLADLDTEDFVVRVEPVEPGNRRGDDRRERERREDDDRRSGRDRRADAAAARGEERRATSDRRDDDERRLDERRGSDDRRAGDDRRLLADQRTADRRKEDREFEGVDRRRDERREIERRSDGG